MNALGRWMSLFLAVGVLVIPCGTRAQGDPSNAPAPNYQRLDATAVGISGGAIAGFELVAAAQALFKVKKAWPYLTIPFVGAAGGAVGGYFLEQASPKGAVALLVGSLALAIPTAVLVSFARAYDPSSENAVEDENSGRRYSFEAAPSTSDSTQKETTSTEVEEAPEQAPDELPPPGEPAPADAPTDPGGAGASARLDDGHLRAASAGALLYLDARSGFAAMALPNVALVSRDNGPLIPGQSTRTSGVEFMIPLLNIDLP